MAQPLMYGLAIEANLPNGQLSLHGYRKFLSQSNDIITMPAEASHRTLKRKPATINLNQAKIHKQPRHDFVFNLYSPVSSAPSSPPPLSFCQSVVTLHGDLPTPVSPSPLPSSTIRSFSRASSVARSSTSQRIVGSFPSFFFCPCLLPGVAMCMHACTLTACCLGFIVVVSLTTTHCPSKSFPHPILLCSSSPNSSDNPVRNPSHPGSNSLKTNQPFHSPTIELHQIRCFLEWKIRILLSITTALLFRFSIPTDLWKDRQLCRRQFVRPPSLG